MMQGRGAQAAVPAGAAKEGTVKCFPYSKFWHREELQATNEGARCTACHTGSAVIHQNLSALVC